MEEDGSASLSEEIAKRLDSAPLLDTVFKTSSRLLPSDSISVRRKVLKPFSLHDGTQLSPGDVVCVPSQAKMLEESLYKDSKKFLLKRFIEREENADWGSVGDAIDGDSIRNKSRFCDPNMQYPISGLGKHSW